MLIFVIASTTAAVATILRLRHIEETRKRARPAPVPVRSERA
ncbi:MAG: hypothetical protein QNJ90_03210 [Planctomycetota bacterium]|nr:hypothetical protein [Planctomycetota bacterium]